MSFDLHWSFGFIEISPFNAVHAFQNTKKSYFGFAHAPLSSFPLLGRTNILLVNYDSWWQHQMSLREHRHDSPSGRFSKSRGLPASVSFLSSAPLPALLLVPFFARSLTLVPRSLLLNLTETLATQARSSCRLEAVESFLLLKYQGSLRLALYQYPYLLIVLNKRQKVF